MLVPLSGTFYRIVFAQYADKVLDGVIHPEGRFHHNGQPTLYASPSPASAAIAIDTYIKPDDPARVMIPLVLRAANIADLRDPNTCAALKIDPAWPSVPWAAERKAGKPATSWRASDAVRNSGADGMIYTSRRDPTRWHLVLFRWNQPSSGTIEKENPLHEIQPKDFKITQS